MLSKIGEGDVLKLMVGIEGEAKKMLAKIKEIDQDVNLKLGIYHNLTSSIIQSKESEYNQG
jgi:uncharacterized protein YoxC